MRILWIKTELLHPVDKGGRIRTYNMLRSLVRHHHLTYLALDDGLAGLMPVPGQRNTLMTSSLCRSTRLPRTAQFSLLTCCETFSHRCHTPWRVTLLANCENKLCA